VAIRERHSFSDGVGSGLRVRGSHRAGGMEAVRQRLQPSLPRLNLSFARIGPRAPCCGYRHLRVCFRGSNLVSAPEKGFPGSSAFSAAGVAMSGRCRSSAPGAVDSRRPSRRGACAPRSPYGLDRAPLQRRPCVERLRLLVAAVHYDPGPLHTNGDVLLLGCDAELHPRPAFPELPAAARF
jgi:hypothetical protein